jgi:hypothetical protein
MQYFLADIEAIFARGVRAGGQPALTALALVPTKVLILHNCLSALKNNSILASPVLHIDETTVRLRKQSGYVWVLTSMHKAYYFFKPSRARIFSPRTPEWVRWRPNIRFLHRL